MRLRESSKRGQRLHPDDQRFVEKMFKVYPEWYASGERAVFIATAPFGSHIG